MNDLNDVEGLEIKYLEFGANRNYKCPQCDEIFHAPTLIGYAFCAKCFNDFIAKNVPRLIEIE